MLLSIPVLDLLHTQLDIGVDPSSGKLSCNIKDIPSRLWQCRSSHASDLVLTLQSSSEDRDPGTLCIRISPSQIAGSEYSSMNIFEVPQFHALAPPCLLDQAEHSAHSMTAGPPIPAAHVQDSFRNVDTYNHSAPGRGSSEAVMNQAAFWASIQDKVPQKSDEPDAISPVSQMLSLIASGSIIQDLATYSSPGIYAFSDSQCDATGIQVDHTGYSMGTTIPHSPPDQINNMTDIQGQLEVERSNVDDASSGSFSIMDLFTPVPHSESSPHASSTAVSPKCDQIILESDTSTPSHYHGVSNHETYPTPSSSSQSQVNSPTEPAREGKGELYPCPFPSCGRLLKSMRSQQIHLKTHQGKPQKHFLCTMGCSESFTRHHDRLRHEVAQHGKQCEFSCKRCERFFSSQRMLDRHTCWSWRNGNLRWPLKATRRVQRLEPRQAQSTDTF